MVAAMGGPRFVAAADGTNRRCQGFGGQEPVPHSVVQTDAHRPVTYHFAVTNTTDKPQTVESVRTSCACLKVKVADATGRVPPGGVLPFEVVFNPTGMEGHVEKRVWVTLAPSGGLPGTARLTKIVTFDVAADVRLRLGFKPMDAAFGVIRRSETGREIVTKLSGYVADGAKLGTPCIIKHRGTETQREDFAAKNAKDTKNEADNKTGLTGLTRLEETKNPDNPVNPVKTNLCASASLREEKDTVFDLQLGADGKSVVVKFRERNVLPGIYSEVWTIPTSDPEIPEIKFPVSARVADAVAVTPQVINVGWDEPMCARMVMVRSDDFSHKERKDRKEGFQILSAETKPRKWGDVKIAPRPLNGWRIDIENIDPREVRQFSKRPFLEVKTNLPGMESFEIPLRVMQNGGTK